jgi:hypothetical protein
MANVFELLTFCEMKGRVQPRVLPRAEKSALVDQAPTRTGWLLDLQLSPVLSILARIRGPFAFAGNFAWPEPGLDVPTSPWDHS